MPRSGYNILLDIAIHYFILIFVALIIDYVFLKKLNTTKEFKYTIVLNIPSVLLTSLVSFYVATSSLGLHLFHMGELLWSLNGPLPTVYPMDKFSLAMTIHFITMLFFKLFISTKLAMKLPKKKLVTNYLYSYLVIFFIFGIKHYLFIQNMENI